MAALVPPLACGSRLHQSAVAACKREASPRLADFPFALRGTSLTAPEVAVTVSSQAETVRPTEARVPRRSMRDVLPLAARLAASREVASPSSLRSEVGLVRPGAAGGLIGVSIA